MNNDTECFRWCHIRYLNPQERDSQRIKRSGKLMVEQMNEGIEFPVRVKDYAKIEAQNNINVVFGYENKEFCPIYVSKQKNENILNLLLITITEKVQGCQPGNAKSYTDKYKKDTRCSYGYKFVCCYDDKYTRPVKIYRGEEPIKKFIQEMLLEVEYCQKNAAKKCNKALRMTDNDECNF